MQEIKGITQETLERADALAFELAARAYVFYNPDSRDVVAEYCETVEEAQECDSRANRIREILAKSCKSELSQEEMEIIEEAAKEWENLVYF